MRIDVVTLFPELFTGPLQTGLLGKALEAGRAEVGFVDPRKYTSDRHRTVDDTPYGGGGGMVMKPEPMVQAIEVARGRGEGPVLLMSPQGTPLRQSALLRWSRGTHVILVAGRYEGFDERIRDVVDEEVSLGDFVLTGGEYAALCLIDGLVRLLPGTLGNAASADQDTFSDGLIEHPQYTRPWVFRDLAVPDVLASGDHARIAAWRRAQSVMRTWRRRPDLLAAVHLDLEDQRALWSSPLGPKMAPLAVAVDDTGLSTNDVKALAELARAYGLEQAWIIGPDAKRLVDSIPAETRNVPVMDKPRSRRAPQEEGMVWSPADLLEPWDSEAAWRAHIASDWVTVGWSSHESEGRVVPEDLRHRSKEGLGWCLYPSHRTEAALPRLRSGIRGASLSPVITLAVALERVRGEG